MQHLQFESDLIWIMAKARKIKRPWFVFKDFWYEPQHDKLFSTFPNSETILFAGSSFHFCHFQFYILLQRLVDWNSLNFVGFIKLYDHYLPVDPAGYKITEYRNEEPAWFICQCSPLHFQERGENQTRWHWYLCNSSKYPR